MITSNSNVEGSHSSTRRCINWQNDRTRTVLRKALNPESFVVNYQSIRLRWSYLGDFHLFSVIRLPLPIEGSANVAHKGSGWNYACRVLPS